MPPQKSEITLPLHPKQKLAFNSKATEILYGGGAGGGKSHLMRVAFITWCALIAGLQCYLFRKHYDDVIKNHMEGPTGFKALLGEWVDKDLVQITETEVRFWNGSKIYLCHCSHPKHLDKYYGAEIHVLGLEESTQFSEQAIRFLRSRVRMPQGIKDLIPDHLKDYFPRILATSNPVGKSQSYWRKRFIKEIKPYEIVKQPAEEGGFYRQFIPALLSDNPDLDEEAYTMGLQGLGSPALVNALLKGDWDSIVGNFFPEYDETVHVVPDFTPPKHWFKYRTFDWGHSEPFNCLWFAVSDGEEFSDAGKKYWFPRGALIIYREWYGCDPKHTDKGLRLQNDVIAKGILQRTLEDDVDITLTDNKPFQATGGPTIASVFRDNGVPLKLADTKRITGWAHLRDRLNGKDGYPMLYIQQKCQFLRDYLPSIEVHENNPEDAVEDGEATHSCDTCRYGCAAYPIVKDAPVKVSSEIVVKQPTFSEALENTIRRSRLGNRKY